MNRESEALMPMPAPARPPVRVDTLKGVALFEGLPDAALHEAIDAGRPRTFAAGAVLFRQEDAAATFYVVLAGRVRVTQITPEGHTVLLRFIQGGQMLGGMVALEGMTYPVNAQAVQETRVLSWSTSAMTRLMDRHPRIMRNTMRLMVERIKELQQRSVELATQRVEQRVARALLRLVRQAGRRTDRGIALDMRLSRQDLAELTGTTLYTVSRVLNRWQSDGLVEIGRQSIAIRKAHPLVEIAEGL